MTRKANQIKKELKEQFGSNYELTFVSEYQFGSNENHRHYEFALLDSNKTRAFIVIECCEEKENKFDLWQYHNFESYFSSWIMLDIARAMHNLNEKDAD